MTPLLKGAAGFVAVTCFIWTGVLWRWQSMPTEVNGGDMRLYLGVLPVTVFALLLAVRWAVRAALAREQVEASGVSRGGEGAAAASAIDGVAEPVREPWHLVGEWLRTPGGASAPELLAAIEAGAPRPCPDIEFQDDDGLPVMTARVADLDTDAVESELQRLAAAAHATAPASATSTPMPARSLRALALLAPLLDALAPSLLAWSQAGSDALTPPSGPAPSTSGRPVRADDQDRRIRVLAAWPEGWDDACCAQPKPGWWSA